MTPSPQQTQQVGLALSGGTTFGIAHVGALKALVENDIPIDCISGTSAGALVASCFAFGMPISQMEEITKNINWRKFSRLAYSRLGFSSNMPMATFITDLLGDVRIEDAKIPLAITATDIETYERVVLRSGSLHEAVRASTCIPGIFAPVELDGRLLVDGGLAENLPVSPLVDMGSTFTIGVNLTSRASGKKPRNVIDVIWNSYAVLLRQQTINSSAKLDILIEPDLDRFDASQFTHADEILTEGYDATQMRIEAIRARLSTGPSASQGILDRIRGFFRRS